MPEPIIVVPYDPLWPMLFAGIGKRIRMVLGSRALRIDHIGSTAIPGLAAKPIIDVQISVANFNEIEGIERAMNALGYEFRPDNADKTQRYFREKPGDRRTHIHIRRAGSFQEAFALLFRDYLRCHPEDAQVYEENKHELAKTYMDDRLNYINGKGPMIWSIIMRANKWSQEVGWHPGESDA